MVKDNTAARNSRIKRAIMMIEQGRKPEGYRLLIENIFKIIEIGIGFVFRSYYTVDNTSVIWRERKEEAVARFLTGKIDTESFLSGLAQSDDPCAYVALVAKNFAVDMIRRNTEPLAGNVSFRADHIRGRDEGVESSADAEIFRDGLNESGVSRKDVDATPLTLLLEAEADRGIYVSGARRILDDLSGENRALWKVVHCDAEAPDSEVVLELSKTRGVSECQVLEELSRRGRRINDARTALKATVDARSSRILELQLRIQETARLMREVGDGRPQDSGELEEELRKRIVRNQRKTLRECSSIERSRYYFHLCRRLELVVRSQEEDRTRLRQEFPEGTEWREVAYILGKWNEQSTPEEVVKATNGATKRYERLKSRIADSIKCAEDLG